MDIQQKLIRLSEIKATATALDKEVKKLSAEIKQSMLDNNEKSLTYGNFKVELQQANSVSFNEEDFMAYAKKLNYDKTLGLVKTVEVLDKEQLEIALYNGYLSQAEVDEFKTVSTSYKFMTKELK